MIGFRFVHDDITQKLPGIYQTAVVLAANLPRIGETVEIHDNSYVVDDVVHVFPSTAGNDVRVFLKDAV